MKRLFCLLIIMLSLALAPRKGFGQWVQTNGPYGGWVFCITHLGNNIFIGAEGGIFESTDQGSNWQRRSNGLPDGLYVYSLTTHGPNIFAGTYEHGVYRSTDSGASWTSASSGLPNSFSARVLGSSTNAIFAPDEIYSYMSPNDGDEWTRIDTNLTEESVPEAVFTVDSTTYLAGAWITQTTDDGSHWAVTSVPPADTFWDIYSMANIGETLFAVDRETGVLRSTNHGETWDNVTTGTLDRSGILFLASIGTNLFAGASDGSVYRTSDSGTTWQLASSGLPIGVGMSCLESYGAELFAGFYGPGVFRSFDSGATWSQCNQGLTNTSVNAITSTSDTTIVGTNAGVFLTADNGLSWLPKRNELKDYSIISLLIDGKNLYAGGQNVYLSTDRGESWSSPDSGLNDYGIHGLIRSGQNLLAGGEPNELNGLFISTNDGLTWSVSSKGFPSPPREIYVFGFLNVGATLLASTLYGTYSSDDEGSSWNQLTPIQATALGQAGSMIFLSSWGPYQGEKGPIFVSDGINGTWYRTTDTSIPRQGIVTCFASVGTTMFVATDSDGIYLTTDYGGSWTNENLGLGDSSVISLAVQGDELLAGTASSGVWRRPLAEMLSPSIVASKIPAPETISVYPDPASSLVTIDCPNLKGAIDASLISITGVTVWRKTLNADGRPFQLDFTGIANGAYRIEFVAGDVRQSSNIILKR